MELIMKYFRVVSKLLIQNASHNGCQNSHLNVLRNGENINHNAAKVQNKECTVVFDHYDLLLSVSECFASY